MCTEKGFMDGNPAHDWLESRTLKVRVEFSTAAYRTGLQRSNLMLLDLETKDRIQV